MDVVFGARLLWRVSVPGAKIRRDRKTHGGRRRQGRDGRKLGFEGR